MQGKWERNWCGGEALWQLWQGGMVVIQTVTADKKSWRIWGGHNNHQLHCCHCPQGFSFLHIQIFIYLKIFECPTNALDDNTQHMLPSWNTTTSHNFNSLSKQPSSAHNNNIIHHHHHSHRHCFINNHVHHQSHIKCLQWQTACSSA